ICHPSLIRHSSFVVFHPVLKSGRLSWPVAFTLVALFIAAVILIIFWRIETWPARTAQQSTARLEKLGNDLRNAFIDIAQLQPRITINNRVYVEQTTPVSQLWFCRGASRLNMNFCIPGWEAPNQSNCTGHSPSKPVST